MARFSSPQFFSAKFNIDPNALDALGVFDPALNMDTPLFIDPILLEHSKHKEISEGAYKSFISHFAMVIKLLKRSKTPQDIEWKNAYYLLNFPEIKYTCLGYGGKGISGSGFGEVLRGRILATAKKIIDIGVEDPQLFTALALFEPDVGADRISDMATNVIIDDLYLFTQAIAKRLQISTERYMLRSGRGWVELPRNISNAKNVPVILVPLDILRKLPISKDWSEAMEAASENSELRFRVNKHIGNIWEAQTQKEKKVVKSEVKNRVLTNKDAFEALLDMIRNVEPKCYNFAADSEGELFWRRHLDVIAVKEPLKISTNPPLDIEKTYRVVSAIVSQYKFLIEERRLGSELYFKGKPRSEKAAQKLFYAIAYSYCKANNIDLTPEADTDNGPVDFKCSSGFNGRVIVELKLSTNNKIMAGYTRQLKKYMVAEETARGIYVVIDVGRIGEKIKKLYEIKNGLVANGILAPEIVAVDGILKASASKL